MKKDKLIAWAVHYFTATGALCALYALVEIASGKPKAALLWLMASQIIDGVDGQLARRYKVAKHTPVIDGNALDLVIDFTTCALVPVLFALKFQLFPDSLKMILSSAIIITSVIWFSRRDIETKDFWFRGFPTAWNLVVSVLWVLRLKQPYNVAITVLFIVLTMTPQVKFHHIMRSPQYRKYTITMFALLIVDTTAMILRKPIRHNAIAIGFIFLWLIYSTWLTIWRSLQPDEVID